MRLPRARLVAASAVTLALGLGAPAIMASSASAATSTGSAATSAAQPAAAALSGPVTGTFKNSAGTGTFSGTFTPKSFQVVNGVLDATGVLNGTMTSADGTSLGTVSKSVTLPVRTTATTAAANSCNVLNLVLGPLNLNLLGLVVTLNEVHLNLTAIPNALVGTLLCDIANLLNSGGALSGLSALLNSLLGAL